MAATPIPLLLSMALLLAGCDGGASGTRPDRSSQIPLPCFPEPGDPVCTINGVDVPRGTWDLYRQFYKDRNPVWTDLQVALNTLEKILIPRAVAYDMVREDLVSVSTRAWEAYDRVINNEAFEKVLLDYTQDEDYRSNLGVIGTFKPDAKELGKLGAAFLYHMWNQPVLVPSTPFIEYHGVFILLVTAETIGELPELSQRTVSAIYLPFFSAGSSQSETSKANLLRTALSRARVTNVKDRELDRILPAIYRQKR